ncbi:MAG TPA: tricarballylate utilization 4Fe-4S protein TcuB [Usitatibacter sp.]|nr:tricarballylate utilization 4Fe-4S protein TcuB [Usitatibacter sp.]
MSAGKPRLEELVAEAQRMLAICNACRYCEGYCAVFPALERRLEFNEGDVHYLANLCHNCGACLYACQYAPPHEFNLNFPKMLAQVRKETYSKYAWPSFLGAAFERNGAVVAISTALAIALLFIITAILGDPVAFFAAHPDSEGSFYAVMPHGTMVTIFGAVFLFAVASLAISLVTFWIDGGETLIDLAAPLPVLSAKADAAVLRNLDDGRRKTFHHFTFYGFMLCFASTAVATIYHYIFGIHAPYPFWSLPVLLGTLGGVGLVVGTLGLIRCGLRRDPDLMDRTQTGMAVGFLVLLLLLGATGLALLAFRETRAMGTLLALHLGVVLAFFVTMPYGKFVHGLYRFAALVRFHLERRRPLPEIGSE